MYPYLVMLWGGFGGTSCNLLSNHVRLCIICKVGSSATLTLVLFCSLDVRYGPPSPGEPLYLRLRRDWPLKAAYDLLTDFQTGSQDVVGQGIGVDAEQCAQCSGQVFRCNLINVYTPMGRAATGRCLLRNHL